MRSDSDAYTLGFPFRPWAGRDSIAAGADIRGYLQYTVREFDLESRIWLGSKVIAGAGGAGRAPDDAVAVA